jgi:hypothetical protein
MRRLLLAGLVASLLAVAATASAAVDHRVTTTSIGGAKLGLSAAAYKQLLRSPATLTKYGDKTQRLTFARNELNVYLDRAGHGTAVFTAAEEFRTASGVGPCSPATKLLRAYAGKLVPYRMRGVERVVAYRLGSLTFIVTPLDRIGAVVLTQKPAMIDEAVSGAQCGQGEEG